MEGRGRSLTCLGKLLFLYYLSEWLATDHVIGIVSELSEAAASLSDLALSLGI